MHDRQIWIVDFGSQYTQLITRKTREIGYSGHIFTVEEVKEALKDHQPRTLVLSGGPQSIFCDSEDYSFFFDLNIPILGVCYGMQLIGQHFKGEVERGEIGEYGANKVEVLDSLFSKVERSFTAWMSHSDHIKTIPHFPSVMRNMLTTFPTHRNEKYTYTSTPSKKKYSYVVLFIWRFCYSSKNNEST